MDTVAPHDSSRRVRVAVIRIGIALLVGGMALSVGAPTEAREARVLADRGVGAEATITEARAGRLDRVEVDVEFEDEFGLSRRAEGIVYCGEPEEVAVGETAEIIYDPDGAVPAQFTRCPQSQEITIPLVIGVVVLAAGTIVLLLRWKRVRWRRRWWGLALLVVGVAFVGASFEDACECREMVYTGVALTVLGTVPIVAPRGPGKAETIAGSDPPNPV